MAEDLTIAQGDKKAQYETLGNYTLYSGLGLVVLFYLSNKF